MRLMRAEVCDLRMAQPRYSAIRLAGMKRRLGVVRSLLRDAPVGPRRDRLQAEADELQRLLVPPLPDRLARFAAV
jgi:hypothetical protein